LALHLKFLRSVCFQLGNFLNTVCMIIQLLPLDNLLAMNLVYVLLEYLIQITLYRDRHSSRFRQCQVALDYFCPVIGRQVYFNPIWYSSSFFCFPAIIQSRYSHLLVCSYSNNLLHPIFHEELSLFLFLVNFHNCLNTLESNVCFDLWIKVHLRFVFLFYGILKLSSFADDY